MEQIWQPVRQWLALYGLQVVGALVTLLMGFFAARVASGFFRRVLVRAKVEATLVGFFGDIMRYLLIAIVIIATLNQLGFATSSLIAVLGGMALAVGLALQGQLASLAAGVLLLITRPFKIGDMVEAGGVTGTVEGISILNTRLSGFDGTKIVMPNTSVWGGKIVNYFETPTRRIDLVFGIGYEDDLKKAKQVLEEIVTADPRVLKDPAPSVVVVELADSSVNLAVRPWVNNADWWSTRCDVIERVKLRFDEEGISIPFPQQDVHLFKQEQEPGPEAQAA